MKAQQNILVTIFDVSTEAYKAFTELKAYKSNAETLIAQALLIKKENSVITTVDSLDQGEQISGGAVMGGLFGALLGVLGGPAGLLIGGSLGMVLGSDVGAAASFGQSSLLEYVAQNLKDGEVAILTLVQEQNEQPLNDFFAQYNTHSQRFDVVHVQSEIIAAKEAHDQSVKHLQQVWREQRKADHSSKLDAFRDEINQKFHQLGEKLNLHK